MMTGCSSAPWPACELIPAAELQGVSAYETQLLQTYRAQARAFLESFAWCTEVREERFAGGLGGVLGVFAMEVLVKGRSREWLWVVAGELPAAYFAWARAPCPCQALQVYGELLERWIDAVLGGTLDRDVFAFAVPATRGEASRLAGKLQVIRRVVWTVLCLPGASSSSSSAGVEPLVTDR